MEIGDEAAKGEGIDNLTVRCLGGQALPLDPGRRVLSPVTRWAQPVGESETLRTLSRTAMNLFGRSINSNGLRRPEDGSRCPSGNRGGGEFKKTQRLSLSTHENWCEHGRLSFARTSVLHENVESYRRSLGEVYCLVRSL